MSDPTGAYGTPVSEGRRPDAGRRRPGTDTRDARHLTGPQRAHDPARPPRQPPDTVGSASIPVPGEDAPAERRRLVAQGRAGADALRSVAAAGAAARPDSHWSELAGQAIDGFRAAAAFLATYPTDPVARAMTAELGVQIPPPRDRSA
jgi:hypothetical protein